MKQETVEHKEFHANSGAPTNNQEWEEELECSWRFGEKNAYMEDLDLIKQIDKQ